MKLYAVRILVFDFPRVCGGTPTCFRDPDGNVLTLLG